jgi:hypothetical protein
VLTTCQPSTVWCSRERLPAAAAQPAKVRQSCSATDFYFFIFFLILKQSVPVYSIPDSLSVNNVYMNAAKLPFLRFYLRLKMKLLPNGLGDVYPSLQ